jgi:hypothetical protein
MYQEKNFFFCTREGREVRQKKNFIKYHYFSMDKDSMIKTRDKYKYFK